MLERFDEIRGLNLPLFFGKKASTRAMNDQNFSKEFMIGEGMILHIILMKFY